MVLTESPLVILSLWPFADLESAVFFGALLRITGNFLSGILAVLGYIYFENQELTTFNFDDTVNSFGLESSISKLALGFFLFDLQDLPANTFYLWAVTQS